MCHLSLRIIPPINSVYGIWRIINGGSLDQYIDAARKEMVRLDINEAIDSLLQNLPSIMSRAFPHWTATLAARGRDLVGYAIYLPNPGVLPYLEIKTPLKIGGLPVWFVSSGVNHIGTLFGVGLKFTGPSAGIKQVWRMDYHAFHRKPPFANRAREISVWADGNYHYHIMKSGLIP